MDGAMYNNQQQLVEKNCDNSASSSSGQSQWIGHITGHRRMVVADEERELYGLLTQRW